MDAAEPPLDSQGNLANVEEAPQLRKRTTIGAHAISWNMQHSVIQVGLHAVDELLKTSIAGGIIFWIQRTITRRLSDSESVAENH